MATEVAAASQSIWYTRNIEPDESNESLLVLYLSRYAY